MSMSKEGSFILGAGVAVIALKMLNRKKPPDAKIKVEQREPARIPAELDDSPSESHEARPVAKAPKRAVRA